MAKDQFKIQDPLLDPYTILKEKHGGYAIEEAIVRTSKDGQKAVVPKVVRYPTTVESAIKWIIEAKLADSERVVSLKEYLKEYSVAKSQLSELINT